jgi:hypothetical protein
MPKQFFLFLILVCSCNLVIAGQNLALRRNYTLSPKPNYYLCTDKSDTIQLTDGKKNGSQWTKKSTVGWQSAEPVVEIVIDFGKKSAINEVRIHTVGGGFAEVEFPEFVAVLVSDDGKGFRFAGLASSKNLTNVRARGYRGVSRPMSIGNINASGQYVKLVIRPNWRYVFIDEIEVFGDSLSAVNNTKLRSNLEVINTVEELLIKVEDYLHLNEMVDATKKAVKENRSYLPGQLRGKILSELEELTQKTELPTNRLYSTNELLEINSQTGKARALIYNAVYEKPFVCLPANPMEMVFEKDMVLRESFKEINIQMWQNEYESAAFNIINCSNEAMIMGVSISPLLGPAGEKIDSSKVFRIRKAEYVKGSTVGSIADVLVLQKNSFTLQPGELRQIWLTIYNPTLTEGIYKGRIGVWAKGEKTINLPIETIPVTIKVQKHKFPENVALHTCNWAYYQVTSSAEMAEDLRNHHINVYTVPPQDLPFLRFSSDLPGVIRKPDFTKLNNALRHHSYVRTFLLCL